MRMGWKLRIWMMETGMRTKGMSEKLEVREGGMCVGKTGIQVAQWKMLAGAKFKANAKRRKNIIVTSAPLLTGLYRRPWR
jgi:hypothetical protein